MLISKINAYKLVRISGEDLTDLIECLSGNDDLSVLIRVVQLYIADRDAVSVESYHSEPVVSDLKELTGHHTAALITGNREDRPADQVSERELGDLYFILLLNLGKIGEICSVLAENCELCFLAGDRDLFPFCKDNNVVIGKLSDNTGEDLRINCNDAS